ncbi:hypothetical protein MRB53_034839 [Persea americana]|uniref:Uncharacterized protein n=1 Tax=Persea americana TaxID=3435 RepID=A0ACC2K3E3_PERAE|nr:hypothetical protein MRB53_034839 [Persea americana]
MTIHLSESFMANWFVRGLREDIYEMRAQENEKGEKPFVSRSSRGVRKPPSSLAALLYEDEEERMARSRGRVRRRQRCSAAGLGCQAMRTTGVQKKRATATNDAEDGDEDDCDRRCRLGCNVEVGSGAACCWTMAVRSMHLLLIFLVWGYEDSGSGKRRGWAAEQGTDIMDGEDEMTDRGARITRLKEHLGGITGEIAACKNVPPEVKWQMERLVMETKKNKEKKRQRNEDIGNPYGNEDEELGEGSEDTDLEEKTAPPKRRKGQELQTSFSSSQNRRKDIPPKAPQPPMSNYFPPRTTPGSQPSIKSAMASKEMKEAADMTIARWWFHASIPFNATRSKFFQPMVNAIASIRAGYKAPSYHDFRGKLLKKSVEEVNRLMVHYKSSWSETGCSIMADGWTDGIQRDMIKRTGKNALDPISLENIDILADWIAEEPTLMTIDEVEGWATVEVGLAEEDIPDFDGGGQVTVAVVEEEDDDDYDDL